MAPVRLVLLPGMDGTGELFGPLKEAMGPRRPIDVVRYPGDEALGYEALEQRVRAQLPTDQPFVLLGESFSGPLAVSVAAAPPPGLRGLILCCSFARNPVPAALGLLPYAPLIALPLRLLPLNLVIAPARHLLLGRFATPALVAMLRASLRQVSPATMARRMQQVLRVNMLDKLARVKLPAMYLQAMQDRLLPARALRQIETALPSIRTVRLEGPHCLLQANPLAAIEAIDSFCRGLEPAAP